MSHCRLLTRHEQLVINSTNGLVADSIVALNAARVRFPDAVPLCGSSESLLSDNRDSHKVKLNCISGLVAEYIVAIDVTRVRFPADAALANPQGRGGVEHHS